MKTTFKAKIIIETDEYKEYNVLSTSDKMLTFQTIKDHINGKKIDIEMIDDCLTINYEPVIIIKLK